MLCVRVGAPYGWIPTVTPFPRNDTRRWFVRCTCDNSHRFLSRRSSRHFVPQDDTWGRGVTRCCLLMSVVSFPGYVSTAFHSAQHDTWWVGCKIATLRNRLPSSLHYMRARTCTYTHTCDSFIHEL